MFEERHRKDITTLAIDPPGPSLESSERALESFEKPFVLACKSPKIEKGLKQYRQEGNNTYTVSRVLQAHYYLKYQDVDECHHRASTPRPWPYDQEDFAHRLHHFFVYQLYPRR
jgi:hypothetical protein